MAENAQSGTAPAAGTTTGDAAKDKAASTATGTTAAGGKASGATGAAKPAG